MTRIAQEERDYLRAIASHAGIEVGDVDLPISHRVRVNGLELHYLVWGSSGARPILLLHGGGQSARTWDLSCLQLSRGYHCFALDQRGHGESDWSERAAYSIDDYAQDIADFIDVVGLQEPIIVGMSMGGINAIAYAARFPSRLRALVSVDVGPEVQFEPVQRLMQGLGAYRYFRNPSDAAVRLSKLGARREKSLLACTLSLNLRKLADGNWTWKYDPRTLIGVSAQEILDERRPLWQVLDRITCPVLVVRGADSEIFSEANAAEFVQHLPHAELVTVSNARHAVQNDNPRDLVMAIMAFDDAINQGSRARSESR